MKERKREDAPIEEFPSINSPHIAQPVSDPPVPNRAWTEMRLGRDIDELTPEEKLQQQLAAYEEKIAAQQDQILRQAAEFDNYRKRTLKEKAELIKNGGEKAITAILPVIDDLERALQNMKSDNEEVTALRDGVELIYNKFLKTLQQEGLEKMDTHEADFNTDYHEAIALVPAPTDELKGKILDCVQTGYQLNDKVIRHAKVVVGQ